MNATYEPFETEFAHTVFKGKYPFTKNEDWVGCSKRVVSNVMTSLKEAPQGRKILTEGDAQDRLFSLLRDRMFIPGGRYLYSSGRPFHQTNNCFEGTTRFLTRNGIRELRDAVGEEIEVRNRFGEWEQATVEYFGLQELYKVVFANGIEVLTTKDHLWWQENGFRKTTLELEEAPFSKVQEFPKIDPEGVRHGIIYGDGFLSNYGRYSKIVFVNPEKDESLATWFDQEDKTVTVGGGAQLKFKTKRKIQAGTCIALQPKHYKKLPNECSPEYARGFIAGLVATDGCVPLSGSVQISQENFDVATKIAELAILAGCVVNSVHITSKVSPYTGQPREMSAISIKPFSAPIILPSHKERIEKKNLRHNFRMNLEVQSIEKTGITAPVYCVVAPDSQSFTLANGLITSNCLLLKAEDKREGWAELKYKTMMALMTGAGIGVYYGDLREKNSRVERTGGKASGPVALMKSVNEDGRAAVQGGDRRSAIWAGLPWWHPDIFDFIRCKDWPEWLREQKAKDWNVEAPMDMTNISVCLDDEFFAAMDSEIHPKHELAKNVYWTALKRMVKTGEPGFSVDLGNQKDEVTRNACCEIVSADDSDVCNLGSIVMPRFATAEQFGASVRDAALFLTAGSLYSDVPYDKVAEIREKNRRLGLGVIGVHEFCLLRGVKYGADESFEVLDPYMREYDRALEYANDWQDRVGISRSIAATAIAPNGTIGIIAESTPSGDPLFSAARKRVVITASPSGDKHTTHVVVDPVAKRLVSNGVDPNNIEDAYSLAYQPERRLAMQAYLQSHVDQAVSSTVNLPYPITDPTEQKDFGQTLLKFLPKLRGITAYPDGARAGQPLASVPLKWALEHEGETKLESVEDTCSGSVCGA